MPNVKPAQATLCEIREGHLMNEAAAAINEATQAAVAHGKPATVTITMTFHPLNKQGIAEPMVAVDAEVATKLPKVPKGSTFFFVDRDGNPSRNQQRQPDLNGLRVATGGTVDTQTGEIRP